MLDLAPLLSEGFNFSEDDLAVVIQKDTKHVSDTQQTSNYVGYPAEFLADFPDFQPQTSDRLGKAA